MLDEQDFNYNVHDNKILSEKTMEIEENKDTNSCDDYNMSKNKRKRKQIFLKLQSDDENFLYTKDIKNSTSAIEESSELESKNFSSKNSTCQPEHRHNLDSSRPLSPTQPSASKRAKTLKTRKPQTQSAYSSPPRPRRPITLSSDTKKKIKGDSAIVRNSKINVAVSNSILKPMYLRPIYIPPDEPNVMFQFLECKKKVQRVDGLYDWVLWKETLRESIDLLNQKSRYEILSSLNKPKPRL